MIVFPFSLGATHDKSISYVKKNKRELLEKFANDEVCLPEDEPFTLFMAGSPGAGKTEYSKTWLQNSGFLAVRIDADEVRKWIPTYTGDNSDQVQGAAALGVQKIYDYVLDKNKSAIMDTTFIPYNIAEENVCRSLKRGRHVEIHYLFQDPFLAWDFTKKRELVEGRKVPKEAFVASLFEARENVKKIKGKYPVVQVTFVVNDFTEGSKPQYFFNINEIDKRTEINYNSEELLRKLT